MLSSAATDWSSGVAVNEEDRKVGRFGLFIRGMPDLSNLVRVRPTSDIVCGESNATGVDSHPN